MHALLSAAVSWTPPLNLANHPLVVQFGCGSLPMGSFNRCLLARDTIVEALETAAASACSGVSVTAEAAEYLSLVVDENSNCERDAEMWRKAAAEAGRTIDLPESEVESGVRCYTCDGTHYNVDCPDEATAPPEALGLASFIKSSSLSASAIVLRDLGFAHTTLVKAGLDGGDAYKACVKAHAERCMKLADACDKAVAAGDSSGNTASEEETARSLLFALVDGESGVAGLKDGGEDGSFMSLQEARERIEEVEPGFLQSQDRNAQFLKETVLGGSPVAATDVAPAATATESAAKKQAARVDAAALYLKAKQASQQPVGKDSQAALQDARASIAAGKAGPKQAAAKKYLALRKKQQAADEYLKAKREKEGDGSG